MSKKIAKKITVGFVIQEFDISTGKCLSQEFIAGDQVDWEKENGEKIKAPTNEDFLYFPFHMVQPIPEPGDTPSFPKEKPWDIPEKE